MIAIESKIATIPVFYTNEAKSRDTSLYVSRVTSASDSTDASNCEDECITTASPIRASRKLSFSPYMMSPQSTIINTYSCTCPHILIADDDTFQHFYYQTLFARSLTFDDAAISREELNVQIYFSGEELLERLCAIQSCGCDKLMLVISDYSMGSDKLCGVDTARRVRGSGYTGGVILRTSETIHDLRKAHADFDRLLENQIISVMVAKDNLKMSKQTIEKWLAKE